MLAFMPVLLFHRFSNSLSTCTLFKGFSSPVPALACGEEEGDANQWRDAAIDGEKNTSYSLQLDL
jgi:hypothetical protein